MWILHIKDFFYDNTFFHTKENLNRCIVFCIQFDKNLENKEIFNLTERCKISKTVISR